MEPGRELEFPVVDVTGPLPVDVPGVATGVSASVSNSWMLTESSWKEKIAKLPHSAPYSAAAWGEKCGVSAVLSLAELPQIESDIARDAGGGWKWLDPRAVSWGLHTLDGFGAGMSHSDWMPLAPGVEIRKTRSKTDDSETFGVQVRPAKNPSTVNPTGTVYVFAYSWHGYEDARMPILDRSHAEGFWAMLAEYKGGDPKGIENWKDFDLPTGQIREYPTGKQPGILAGPPRLAVKAFTVEGATALTEAGLLAELRSLKQ